MTPIVRLVTEPAVIAVKADSPYKTLKDFIGRGAEESRQAEAVGWLADEPRRRDAALLQKATGAQWAFISFPGGGERIAALLGGHVELMIVEPQEAGEHIRNGNMRVIAQVADDRLKAFADVPTIRRPVSMSRTTRCFAASSARPACRGKRSRTTKTISRGSSKRRRGKSISRRISSMMLSRESGEFAKFIDEFAERVRPILTDAGVKVYR